MSKFAERHKEIDWDPLPSWGKRSQRRSTDPAPYFVPDVTPFVSPIDRSEITSRSQLREHERRHSVRQCGELKTAGDFDHSREPYQYSERKLDDAIRRAANRIPD